MQGEAGKQGLIISPEEWERRKRFVGFSEQDVKILRELHLIARTYADDVMEALYARWLQFDELKLFFPNRTILARVKSLQKQYFISLTSSDYGMEYLHERLKIGQVHKRIGLSPRWYMGAYSIYLQIVLPKILDAFEYDRSKRQKAVEALVKLISLDQEIALTAYFNEKDA